MEAHLQIHSMACLMGALRGTTHKVVLCYKVVLWKYDLMEPRVRREFKMVHGTRMGPALVVFHVQLMGRSWLAEKANSDTYLPLPDICTGLCTLEQNNNLSWVPSCVNVPELQTLLWVARPVVATHQATRAVPSGGNGGGG
jgi:hypothetical protein